ncbi:MAG: hypothetical protein JO057_14115 [Chloroflexi bacterium]|nr:hypothetical protein [Chloroflexota bacterium]
MPEILAALYARVSSEQRAEEHTIDSSSEGMTKWGRSGCHEVLMDRLIGGGVPYPATLRRLIEALELPGAERATLLAVRGRPAATGARPSPRKLE